MPGSFYFTVMKCFVYAPTSPVREIQTTVSCARRHVVADVCLQPVDRELSWSLIVFGDLCRVDFYLIVPSVAIYKQLVTEACQTKHPCPISHR